MFHLFPCFVINSATFLSEEVCICSSGLALLRRRFPRTLSTVSPPQFFKTNWLRFASLLAADIVNHDIRDPDRSGKRKMSLSLMTAFSTVPAVKKTELGSKFLTTRICISKGFRMLALSWVMKHTDPCQTAAC